MILTYKPKGVCSRSMNIHVEDGVVVSVEIIGGCSGNSKGLAALVKGRPVVEVIERLRGTKCEGKRTSCPDQLALALEQTIQ